jgi:cellulose synthase/poly-beta-1,6-N-acetylglucosamine synthase-like glycosyltransferase
MTFIVALALAPLTLLTFAFAFELIMGLIPLPTSPADRVVATTTVIVVPAHDEESIIEQSLTILVDAAAGLARILVVADNCHDLTATIARRAGVEVIERVDPVNRGKGFALDFARRHLRKNSPDVVLVLDADCAIDSQSMARLVISCATSGRPCQAIYVQEEVPDGPATLQLSTFAFYIKNVVRQRALFRLAGRVHLHGSGMAIPWSLFENAKLANGNIVEDLEMGLEFTRAGQAPLMVEGALVVSKPALLKNTMEQRRRWEGGFLASAAKWVPPILSASIRLRQREELWTVIDLLIPPFTLLIILDICAAVLGSLACYFGKAGTWPLLLLIFALTTSGIGIISAWALGGRRFISLKGLATIPLYIFWKLPLYARLVRSGAPKEWVRTGRS